MDNNYRTLHKDIGLIQRTNNGWDLWFDNGDTVRAEDFHSLQVGIIIACLTSWNYMNRYGNPTYEIFGNRAYQLLKSNKSSMTAYKIQQFFLECLKRMRRIYEVVSLEVYEVPYEPHKYFVEFEVISINNQLVDGSFTVATDTSKATSFISYDTFMPYASNTNPLTIDLYLQNEYGGGLEGEILYMYLKKGDGDYEFIGVTDKTDEDGYVRVTYTPKPIYNSGGVLVDDGNHEENVIYFDFKGNTTHNPTTSKRTIFKSELYDYDVEFVEDTENIGKIYTVEEYNILHFRLLETSQLTNETAPKTQTTILIKGDDGSFYEVMTDFEGVATIRTKQEQAITTYTVYYSDKEESFMVEVVQLTPVFDEFIGGEYYVYDTLVFDNVLRGNLDRPLPNIGAKIDYVVRDLDDPQYTVDMQTEESSVTYPIIYEGSVNSKTNVSGLLNANIPLPCHGEYTFTITTSETIFYESITEEIVLNVSKYDTSITVEVDKEHYFGDEVITVTATVQCLTGRLIPKTLPLTVDFHGVFDGISKSIGTVDVGSDRKVVFKTTPLKLGLDVDDVNCNASFDVVLNETEYNNDYYTSYSVNVTPHEYHMSMEVIEDGE